MKLILASQSPRRKELLGLLGLPFEIRASNADETMAPDRDIAEQVALVSRRKAEATPREENSVVIAADTIVVCDEKRLGKPKNREEAIKMLRLLSGRTHQVMTGMTVLWQDKVYSCTEVTEVTFRPLTDREITRYVDSGDCMDKAGAYGIQGKGSAFVQRINGDYFAVVGFPCCYVNTVLNQLGIYPTK